MKKFMGAISTGISAGIFSIAISHTAFANAEQRVCLSNDTQPKHCRAGDIIVISPQEIATSCDFKQQIVKLKPSKTSIEFLCTYTGRILKIRPNTSKPPQQLRNPYPANPPRKKKFFW
ncbi:MAG: hypothetical protein QM479_00850 [Pseudomonadota bacterium]